MDTSGLEYFTTWWWTTAFGMHRKYSANDQIPWDSQLANIFTGLPTENTGRIIDGLGQHMNVGEGAKGHGQNGEHGQQRLGDIFEFKIFQNQKNGIKKSDFMV